MFEKKCKNCRKRIDKDFEFCPYCGFNIKKEENERNYGFLGKDDEIKFPSFGMKMPFGFDRIFSGLLNQIDRQFKELDKGIGKDAEKMKKEKFPVQGMNKGISISISTATGRKPEIKVSGFGPGFENLSAENMKEKPIKLKQLEITEERAKRFAKLPREEAETKVRRLSNKVIYEINMPGVSSLKDIAINKLENSIEIKAFGKEKVYFKLLPIGLPLLNCKLEDEKLIMELKAN